MTRQSSHAILQEVDPHKNQGESGERQPQVPLTGRDHQVKQGAKTHYRQHPCAQADLEASERHEPARTCRTHVGSNDDSKRLSNRQQSRAHEADRGHRRRAGGLDERREKRARHERLHAGRGRALESPPEAMPGRRLQPIGQKAHADQEKAYSTKYGRK